MQELVFSYRSGLLRFLVLLNFFLILTVGGCTAYEPTIYDQQAKGEDAIIVWPNPPQTPRIQYIQSISGPSDIGVRKSWFKKAIDNIFGTETMEDRMLRPYGIFADSERIYVTDPGLFLIHVFDMNGRRYSQIKRANEKELLSPIGIVVDNNREIYVSDSLLRRIFIFSEQGKYLREIGAPDMFIRPTGIAIDEDRVYIVDTHGHHVLVFSKKDGKFLFSFGKNGSKKGDFNYPTNIFISKEKLIYITDSMNFRVQIFDRDGNFLSTFGNFEIKITAIIKRNIKVKTQ